MFTRKDYLDGMCSHRAYYAQLVTPGIRALVASRIGLERLRASTDEHLNDIPLGEWDRMAPAVRARFKELGDFASLGGQVCVLKEAARQLIEEEGD